MIRLPPGLLKPCCLREKVYSCLVREKGGLHSQRKGLLFGKEMAYFILTLLFIFYSYLRWYESFSSCDSNCNKSHYNHHWTSTNLLAPNNRIFQKR